MKRQLPAFIKCQQLPFLSTVDQGVLFHDNLINKQPAAEAAWLRLNTDVAGSLTTLPGKRLEIQTRLLARLILLVEYLGEVLAILTN